MATFLLKTIDDCLLEARLMVNDSVVPYRNADAVYIQYLNSALRAVYSVRPDAFIGNFTQGVLSYQGVVTYAVTDLQVVDGVANQTPPTPAVPFPIDDRQFFYPVVSYVAGRIELADDEYVAAGTGQSSARATQLLQAFHQQLAGA